MPVLSEAPPDTQRPDRSALFLVTPVGAADDESVQLVNHAARLAEDAGLSVELQRWSLCEGGRQFLMLTVRGPAA